MLGCRHPAVRILIGWLSNEKINRKTAIEDVGVYVCDIHLKMFMYVRLYEMQLVNISFRLRYDCNYFEFTLKNEHKFPLSPRCFAVPFQFCMSMRMSEFDVIDDRTQNQSIMTKVYEKMYIVLSEIKKKSVSALAFIQDLTGVT